MVSLDDLNYSDEEFDQFAVNEQKFGIKSDYSFDQYTTTVDSKDPNYNKVASKAKIIAAEIEKTGHRDGEVNASSEELKFSKVLKTGDLFKIVNQNQNTIQNETPSPVPKPLAEPKSDLSNNPDTVATQQSPPSNSVEKPTSAVEIQPNTTDVTVSTSSTEATSEQRSSTSSKSANSASSSTPMSTPTKTLSNLDLSAEEFNIESSPSHYQNQAYIINPQQMSQVQYISPGTYSSPVLSNTVFPSHYPVYAAYPPMVSPPYQFSHVSPSIPPMSYVVMNPVPTPPSYSSPMRQMNNRPSSRSSSHGRSHTNQT